MRYLGIGDDADLASLYLRLIEGGHEVKICIGNPLCGDTLAGLVTRAMDWQSEVPWVREAGQEGCILFENVGAGPERAARPFERDMLPCEAWRKAKAMRSARMRSSRTLTGNGLPLRAA
jgi:hypothetical protein